MRTFAPVVALFSLWGCGSGSGSPDPHADPPINDRSAALSRFGDCADVKSYVSDAWLETIVQARYGGYGRYAAEDAASDAGSLDAGAGDGPSDYSETNNQEAGVDEPDIVKTDGNYVYVVQQARPELTVVKSWPIDDAEVVGTLPLEGWPMSMFLHEDRAVVFSYIYSDYDERGQSDSPYRDGFATRLTLVDLSDRTAPVVERTVDVEGWMASARLIEDDLYVVFDSQAWVPTEVWELTWDEDLDLPEMDWDAPDEVQEAARIEARSILAPLVDDIVQATPTSELLPRQHVQVERGPLEAEELVACADIYHPETVSSPGVLSVAHLDLADEAPELTATGVMAAGWTVYASKRSLYVAQTSRWWWWGWGDLDLDTHIHRFELAGDASRYAASGSVPGWLWSQFAMSEHDGHLRVATTDIDWWWGLREEEEEGANNVFVLDQSLRQVGAVTGFAPGEQIYAARFLGDEGYVVTFRQIDPLFTFDLSVPSAPRLMGELEMPGFSSYLHPVGDDHLLGVGMDGDEEGNIRGLSVNLFDVSDLTAPARVAQRVLTSDDWSWSAALWDHHAFTYHRDVLSLPVYTWDWDESTGFGTGFSGMWSLAVGESTLTELGKVGHADLVDDSECLYRWYDEGDERTRACPDDLWYASMRRSVVIEDNLLSISDYGIKITDLEDPSTEHARVLFWPLD